MLSGAPSPPRRAPPRRSPDGGQSAHERAKGRARQAEPAGRGTDEAEAKAELKRLAEEIAHHDRLYYQKDAPEISDAEYDALRRRNAAIEARFPELVRADSPSARRRRAGAGFAKVGIATPMLSLDNAFDEEDVRAFFQSMRNFFRAPRICTGRPSIHRGHGRAQDRRAVRSICATSTASSCMGRRAATA